VYFHGFGINSILPADDELGVVPGLIGVAVNVTDNACAYSGC
jgi:hypothetical protein